MAIKRYTIDGYGQIELNNVAFRRDGRIEAQCKLDTTDFATIPAENGMILAVDKAKGTITLPKEGSLVYALNYTTEHIYDERTPGLKNFASTITSFMPRMGYLAAGDLFTTNTICYNDGEYANDAALETALTTALTNGTVVYGGIDASGAIKLTATKPTVGPVLRVVKKYTMPDGQFGVKLQVISA